jgi:hypothetical protein
MRNPTRTKGGRYMATRTLPQVEVPGSAPHTFQDALKAGWTVASDKSVQRINEKRREGKITMQKPGCSQLLAVDYVGSKRGFRFSVPKFVN